MSEVPLYRALAICRVLGGGGRRIQYDEEDELYRGTSRIRNSASLGPYSGTMPMGLRRP